MFNLKNSDDIISFNTALRQISLKECLAVLILVCIITSFIFFIVFDTSEDTFYCFFVLIMLFYFAYKCRGSIGFKYSIKEVFDIKYQKEIWFVFIVNVLFAIAILSMITIINNWVFDLSSIQNLIEESTVSNSPFIIEFISVVILTPIFEELIFRGVLFNRLSLKVSLIPAILISSFIFAIGHPFGGIISAFLFGVCMCVLYYKTDNIFVPVSVHFLNNFSCTIVDSMDPNGILFTDPWIFLLAIISIIGGILLIKYVINEVSILKKSS